MFISVNVGKGEHHGVLLNRARKHLFDKALPTNRAGSALVYGLKDHGALLLVVDQPATIGALPIAAVRVTEVLVGYLPGLAMHRLSDLHAGRAKTDARDAAIIAEAVRTFPQALTSIQLKNE